MTMKTRAELDQSLDELDAWVPIMLTTTAEVDQMDAFNMRAEQIKRAAAPTDQIHVHDVVQRILSDNCMVPSDEGPCA